MSRSGTLGFVTFTKTTISLLLFALAERLRAEKIIP
jgi:hypothetical protein